MTTLRFFIVLVILTGTAAATVRAAGSQLPLLPLYEKVAAALSADDLAAAKAAAQNLAAEAVKLHHDGVANSAGAVARAGDIAGARTAFKALSTEAIALAKLTKGYFIMTCPMAQADWVQSARAVANPYLGKSMPTCGSVKEETKG